MKEKLCCMLLLAGGLTASLAQADVVRVPMFEMFETASSVNNFNNGNAWLMSSAQSAATSYTGTSCLSLVCNHNITGGENWQMYQWISGSQWWNAPYMQVEFKNASSTYTAGSLTLQYWDGNSTNNWVTIGEIMVPANNSQWYTYAFNMSSHDLQWVTGFRFVTSNLSEGTYYVDDIVRLSAIPEPASLALLGLGGLALLRRRRS